MVILRSMRIFVGDVSLCIHLLVSILFKLHLIWELMLKIASFGECT